MFQSFTTHHGSDTFIKEFSAIINRQNAQNENGLFNILCIDENRVSRKINRGSRLRNTVTSLPPARSMQVRRVKFAARSRERRKWVNGPEWEWFRLSSKKKKKREVEVPRNSFPPKLCKSRCVPVVGIYRRRL